MDRAKVRKKNGKVFSLKEVKLLKKYYLSQDYRVELHPYKKITDTGLLIIGELIPVEKELPIFSFRWDEKKEELDVDINNVKDAIKNRFKEEKNGYEGHHSIRLQNKKGRVFRINVGLPANDIFQGDIAVPVARELELNNTVHLI